jgi:putative transcriptional regulator
MMTIAEQIKTARQRAGLSQAQAARAWGVSLRTLQEWEQGRSEPRGGTWETLRAKLAARPRRVKSG